jgi:hypothetical protein
MAILHLNVKLILHLILYTYGNILFKHKAIHVYTIKCKIDGPTNTSFIPVLMFLIC